MAPFCPHCRAEYRPGFKTCSDCQADLVEHLPKEGAGSNGNTEQMVSVFEAPDQMSALAVSALLADHDIESVVRSDQIPMYDGVAKMLFPRWGRVMVLEGWERQARELIEEFLAGPALPDEPEEPVGEGQ